MASKVIKPMNSNTDKSQIADLVAKYGSSSATAWLEFERYQIWTAPNPIRESSFPPVQGYMQREGYVFAWGNPLVSDPAALKPTVSAFREWVESQDMKLVWACVDEDLEHVLASPPFEWSVVECIYEDVIDPEHVIDLTSPEAEGKPGGASVVKDLKKNLRKADKADVRVEQVKPETLSGEDKRAVEQGLVDWKNSRSGVQIASTTLQAWLDSEHRRYWLARQENKVVGILILSPIRPNSWQIKNAVSFPDAPKGTSETLIYSALVDLQKEKESMSSGGNSDRITVTFGISAAKEVQPVENLNGWKISVLSKAYKNVSRAAGLMKRGDFRGKFNGEKEPMFVCYPPEKFGLEGVDILVKCLRK